MATVFLPTLLRALAGGRDSVDVAGETVRQVIENLEDSCPGIKERLLEDGRLRRNISVAVDGDVSPIGVLESVGPQSEIHFLVAISGGTTGLRAIQLADSASFLR